MIRKSFTYVSPSNLDLNRRAAYRIYKKTQQFASSYKNKLYYFIFYQISSGIILFYYLTNITIILLYSISTRKS